jgi:hypothetical protein
VSDKSFGEVAYEAYWERAEGRPTTGVIDPVPPFDELAPQVRDAWENAAAAVIDYRDSLEDPEGPEDFTPA